MSKCNIVQAAKRRDGKYRYWCLEHKANATAKYGIQMERCEAADEPEIPESEIFNLNASDYPGGIALWGALPAVYDTSGRKMDRGIHLHARKEDKGTKVIDQTYRRLVLDVNGETVEISEEDAIYYMTAVVFGHKLKVVRCSHCGYSHLDKDVLAVRPHKKHLCAGCGRDFFDSEPHIGNPIMEVKHKLGDVTVQREVVSANRTLDISQNDFPGGISIWGANQALLWLSNATEEDGIHVHTYDDKGIRIHDDTYSKVVVDGVELPANQVKIFMAQMAIPHLRDSILPLKCTNCNEDHFDFGEYAYQLHITHICEHCGAEFESPFRKKKTISNPVVQTLKNLENNTNLKRADPFIRLRREGELYFGKQ